MTLEELQLLLAGEYKDVIKSVQATRGEGDFDKIKAQLNTDGHKIFSGTSRPDKNYTEKTQDPNGTESSNIVAVPVARLALPMQKRIVNTAATFLCGRPIELIATTIDDKQKKLLVAMQKVWDDNKLDYKNKGVAKLMFGETEAAEIWYTEEIPPDDLYWKNVLSDAAKFRLRMRIISNGKGDRLYPIFDGSGNMIAFGRGYETVSGEKTQKHFDIYTAETNFIGTEIEGAYTVVKEQNLFKKIPVIYYSQPLPEWSDVQTLIERYEEQLSNLADTNDYFGSPMVVVTGGIKSFAKKGATNKMVEVEPGGDVKYATWQQAPESVRMEMDILKKEIYAMTDTPDISFAEMKSLGQFSGIALKMLFMAAHMKASEKEETFGESIQRRINYISAALQVIDIASFKDVLLTIKPKFTYFLPENVSEDIQNLVTAKDNGLMSQQSAVNKMPKDLILDPAAELLLIQAETDAAAANAAQGLNNTFN